MGEPNFFLLGAPKCATTSFYEMLSNHPQIWCPSVKEPGFYTRDDVREDIVRSAPHLSSKEGYLELYRNADPKFRVFCDGSTSYLRSTAAMAVIKQDFPESHAMAVVRDPVQLVSSYYTFLLHEGWEDQPSLEAAWAVRKQRRAGDKIPAGARRRSSVTYSEVAMLGAQVRDARRIFGECLRVYTLRDLQESLPDISREIQQFIGVDHIDLGELPKLNPARTAKNAWLNNMVKTPPKPVAKVRDQLKRHLNLSSLGLRKRLESLNSTPVKRSVSDETIQLMRKYFSEDVDILSEEMSRDLKTEWGWQ